MVAYNHNTQCSLYCARICINRRLRAQQMQLARQRGQDKNLLNKSCAQDDGEGGGENTCGGKREILVAGPSRAAAIRPGWQASDEDEIDARPEGIPYSNYDILITIYSMITYVLDLGSDFWVAYYHYVRAVEAGEVMRLGRFFGGFVKFLNKE